MKDRLGLAFFTFAAVVSLLAAWERPALLAWLVVLLAAVPSSAIPVRIASTGPASAARPMSSQQRFRMGRIIIPGSVPRRMLP